MSIDKNLECSTTNDLFPFRRRNPRSLHINMHRALRAMHFPKQRYFSVLGLPIIFNLFTLLLKSEIVLWWEGILAASISWTGIPAKAVLSGSDSNNLLDIVIPYVDVAVTTPTLTQWRLGAFFFVFLWLLSTLLPARLVPIRYGLKILAFIQATALLYFAFWPAMFPHAVDEYVRSNFRLTIELILFLPWIHALTYYIYGFKWYFNVGFTLTAILFLIVAAPLQYFSHVLILYNGSLLWLPLLYLAFGLLPVVMVMIAIYAWSMTWPR